MSMHGVQKFRYGNDRNRSPGACRRRKQSKRRKFKKGPKIRTIGYLVKLLTNHKWIYWFDRPKHYSVFERITLRTAMYAIKKGVLRQAIPTDVDDRPTDRATLGQ